MLTHRLQVLIEPAQHARLEAEARSRGVTIGALVRAAIDQVAPDRGDDRRRALEALLSFDPMPVPADPADLERELEGMLDDTVGDL